MRWLAVLALAFALPAQAEFCSDMTTRYGDNILRCFDFATSQEASINWVNDRLGQAQISAHLFDGSVTATSGSTGSLHWKIKSYNQLRAEQPGEAKGWTWTDSIATGVGVWQRWFGIDKLVPGTTYWIQFKTRFNTPYKTWWGGSGPKVFGFDAGCRTVGGTPIPTVCEQYSGNRVTDLGTAMSMEFGTMTTTNWYGTGPGRPIPTAYRGSSNYGLTWGMTPLITSQWGTAQVIQPGNDSGGTWNGSVWSNDTCNYQRILQGNLGPDSVFGVTGNAADPCVGYGAADVWHQWTIAIRSSGNFYDTNSGSVTNRTFRHDSLFKVWYDGQLIVDYDPDAPALPGQTATATCNATQSSDLSWTTCRSSGIDIIRDSRAVTISQGGGAAWCEYACPALYPGDEGADLTQLLLWVFSYRRGYPPSDQVWCNTELGASDPRYTACISLSGSGPSPGDTTGLGQWEAFLSHQEVNLYYDDVVISKAPLPMQKRPAGSRIGAGSFGLDSRDVDALPPYTWTRLFPGPDKTFYNTGYGTLPTSDPYTIGFNTPATPTAGVSTMSGTNYAVEVPVQIGVPLGGGFVSPMYGNNKILYFGGGHSGYMANRVNVYDVSSGRWSQSSYTPDMGLQIGGAIGPRGATPPGTGCLTSTYTLPGNPEGATTYFQVTGNTQSGSPVITGISPSNSNMCPIIGLCPGQNAVVGGYGIFGTGIPAGAVIKTVDSATQVTLTHNATATATGVALQGGRPTCEAGGTPNGSAGGRGWWEHMDDRYAWDPRAEAWMLVQNSGTWLYKDTTETWQLITGPFGAPGTSMICGPGDYTRLGIRFATVLNRMLAWCSTDAIYGFDYGSGAPSYTGAQWRLLHTLAQHDRNPQTDVLSQLVWDGVKNKLYHFDIKSESAYTGEVVNGVPTGYWNPLLLWFNPLGGTSCIDAPNGPCGTSGRFDKLKPNYPQARSSPRDINTFAPDESICWFEVCQQVTGTLAIDAEGNVYVVGRRSVDAQIMLWKLSDPLGPAETWTILQNFSFNTYDNLNLPLWTDNTAPADIDGKEFSLASSTMGLLLYSTDRDMFFLITRSGSGQGGASTRGTGSPTGGGCYLNGVADDCFRMYGFSFTGGAAPPPDPPDPDLVAPGVSVTAPTNGTEVSGTVTFSASATDNVGVTRVEFYIGQTLLVTDMSAPYTTQWDTTAGSDGVKSLSAKAYDAASNFSSSAAISVTVNNAPQPPPPDQTPPTVSVTAPANGATVSGTIAFSAAASDNVGISRVEFYAGPLLLDTDTVAPFSTQWNTVTTANGSASLTAKAFDAAGNNTTSSAVVVTVANNVDTTPPAVLITMPANGAVVDRRIGNLLIMSAASDNFGGAGITQQFFIDGELRNTVVGANASYTWQTRNVPKGSHQIMVRATDAAGNFSTHTHTVTVVSSAQGGGSGTGGAGPGGKFTVVAPDKDFTVRR